MEQPPANVNNNRQLQAQRNQNSNKLAKASEVVDLLSDSDGEEAATVPHEQPPTRPAASKSKPQPPAVAAASSQNSVVDVLDTDDDEEEEEKKKLRMRGASSLRRSEASSKQQKQGKINAKTNGSPANKKNANGPSKTVIALSSDESSDDDEDEEVKQRPTTNAIGEKEKPASKPTKKNTEVAPKKAKATSKVYDAEEARNRQGAFVCKSTKSTASKTVARAKASTYHLEDDSSDDESNSDSEQSPKRPMVQKRPASSIDSSDDDESASDSEVEVIEMDSSSSDEDEPKNTKQMARKSVVMRAGGGLLRTPAASKSTSTMRGLAKAPTNRRTESRIYTSSSESEDDGSSSSSSSESEGDKDDSDSEGSVLSVEQHNTMQTKKKYRFAQKTAADRFSGKEKISARKSAKPLHSSQSTLSDDDESCRREAVTESDSSSRSSSMETEQETRNKENYQQSQRGLQPSHAASAEGEKKRNLDSGEENNLYRTPKPNKRRKLTIDSSSDDEFAESDAPGANFALAAKSPDPLPPRRCRDKPAKFLDEYRSPMDSPHATPGELGEQGDKLMIQVDHLTKVEINPNTGLPFMKMTCHAEKAEILYDFREYRSIGQDRAIAKSRYAKISHFGLCFDVCSRR